MASIAANALASRQAVGLHHDRRAAAADEFARRLGIVEAFPVGRRNAGRVAQFLGERLAAFELRGGLRRPDAGDAGGLHRVGDAGDQGGFRAGDDEVDRVVAREGDESRNVHCADRDAGGDSGNAGVAGRAPEFREQRTGGDRPAQRVLASARSDHQHAHRRTSSLQESVPVA